MVNHLYYMQANVDEHWTNVDLICPITGVKIIQPVRLPLCDDVFDRIGVLKKLKGMNDIEYRKIAWVCTYTQQHCLP